MKPYEQLITKTELKEYVTPYYQDKDIMHDLSHIERVLKAVDKLVKPYQEQVDTDIINYAAYFHGCIYNFEEEIYNWLVDKGLSKARTQEIINAAWASQKEEVPETLEEKILHDAHMIEGGKTFLVVKSLITGSVRGQTLEETINYIETNILDRGKCYLTKAQIIYKQQQEFAKELIKDLKKNI